MAEYVFEIDETRSDAMGNMPCERREEVVRCRDCKNAFELEGGWAIDFPGKFNCSRYAQWDYYDDEPGVWLVEPDGFCAWGRRKEVSDDADR